MLNILRLEGFQPRLIFVNRLNIFFRSGREKNIKKSYPFRQNEIRCEIYLRGRIRIRRNRNRAIQSSADRNIASYRRGRFRRILLTALHRADIIIHPAFSKRRSCRNTCD